MIYCLLNYRPTPDGRGLAPECPDGTPFLLLADLPGVHWGIFEVGAHSDWVPTDPVGRELELLIESGKRYPPALALARDETKRVFGEQVPKREDFSRAYAVAVRHHLAQQHASPHVLAQALQDEVGYLTRGEWYWVLQISGSPPVASWVSADFHIYNNGMNDFDLTGQQLKRLGFAG